MYKPGKAAYAAFEKKLSTLHKNCVDDDEAEEIGVEYPEKCVADFTPLLQDARAVPHFYFAAQAHIQLLLNFVCPRGNEERWMLRGPDHVDEFPDWFETAVDYFQANNFLIYNPGDPTMVLSDGEDHDCFRQVEYELFLLILRNLPDLSEKDECIPGLLYLINSIHKGMNGEFLTSALMRVTAVLEDWSNIKKAETIYGLRWYTSTGGHLIRRKLPAEVGSCIVEFTAAVPYNLTQHLNTAAQIAGEIGAPTGTAFPPPFSGPQPKYYRVEPMPQGQGSRCDQCHSNGCAVPAPIFFDRDTGNWKHPANSPVEPPFKCDCACKHGGGGLMAELNKKYGEEDGG